MRRRENTMANPEHVDILRQGVEIWNEWRKEHPEVEPNLSGVEFSSADLSRANLINTDLHEAKLIRTNLYKADLFCAHLGGAYLAGANLTKARVVAVIFEVADLEGAILRGTNLYAAHFIQTNLMGTDLGKASLGRTLFADVDLRQVKGLESIEHRGPSSVDIHTLLRSEGQIPKIFLKGIEAPDTFITYVRSLVNRPIEYYTCFISYSSKDQAFAERLYNDLQGNNVRCWYAPEDLKIGDKFRVRIDESIRFYDKLLLILSEHSVRSPWVETELETAFSKEHKTGKLALFPVKLDNTVEETEQDWAATIHRTRHIGDFTRWKEHDKYQKGLSRLLRDLKQEAIHDTIESDADKDEKQSTSREIQS
jgi:hypothetical protein